MESGSHKSRSRKWVVDLQILRSRFRLNSIDLGYAVASLAKDLRLTDFLTSYVVNKI